MIKVIAVFKPFVLEKVLGELDAFEISNLTVEEVRGYGRQKGHLDLYRGDQFFRAFLPKVRISFLAAAEFADDIVSAIRKQARTGRIGDGKIFILPAAKPPERQARPPIRE